MSEHAASCKLQNDICTPSEVATEISELAKLDEARRWQVKYLSELELCGMRLKP